jgi:DUF971 family protein
MNHAPKQIKLHRRSRTLELVFADGSYQLPAEYLRVYSPSAEVKGHGQGQEVLQTGKRDVAITGVEPQGNYAVKLVFDDGHDTGIYSWPYLYELSTQYEAKWNDYLRRLQQAGKTRDPDVSVVRLLDP